MFPSIVCCHSFNHHCYSFPNSQFSSSALFIIEDSKASVLTSKLHREWQVHEDDH